MTHWTSRGATLLLAFAVTATAKAQEPNMVTSPFTFGVFGGAAFPFGDLKDGANTGFNVGGLLGIVTPYPLGLRLDVDYTRFGKEEQSFSDGPGTLLTVSAEPSIISGTLNAVFLVPVSPTTTVRPYFIGGAGAYNARPNIECSGTLCDAIGDIDEDSRTKFGLNAGGGLDFRLAGFATFLEARWNWILDALTDTDEDGNDIGDANATFGLLRFGIRFR